MVVPRSLLATMPPGAISQRRIPTPGSLASAIQICALVPEPVMNGPLKFTEGLGQLSWRKTSRRRRHANGIGAPGRRIRVAILPIPNDHIGAAQGPGTAIRKIDYANAGGAVVDLDFYAGSRGLIEQIADADGAGGRECEIGNS